MGMFNYVKPHNKWLPVEYHDLDNWQTKDAVKPALDVLEITEEGRLFHKYHKYEWVNDDGDFMGGYMKPIKTFIEDTHYHGDLVFYTSIGDINSLTWHLVELKARFTHGQLGYVKEIKYDLSI